MGSFGVRLSINLSLGADMSSIDQQLIEKASRGIKDQTKLGPYLLSLNQR